MKVKVTINYPWPGVASDEDIIEVHDDDTPEMIAIAAQDVIEDILFNRVDVSWEVVKDEEV